MRVLSVCIQVGIDLIGPLPTTAKGNKYIVTLVDYFSRWPEAAGLPDKTAQGVAMFLYDLFCRFGSMHANLIFITVCYKIIQIWLL